MKKETGNWGIEIKREKGGEGLAGGIGFISYQKFVDKPSSLNDDRVYLLSCGRLVLSI